MFTKNLKNILNFKQKKMVILNLYIKYGTLINNKKLNLLYIKHLIKVSFTNLLTQIFYNGFFLNFLICKFSNFRVR